MWPARQKELPTPALAYLRMYNVVTPKRVCPKLTEEEPYPSLNNTQYQARARHLCGREIKISCVIKYTLHTSNHCSECSFLHPEGQQRLPLLNGSFATHLKFAMMTDRYGGACSY